MNNDSEEKIVHAAPVPPFVRFVASAVPMVFDNSLSYYEALCALWKWLQDDVIDVINNNASVTELWRQELTTFEDDLTDKFNDLKDAFDQLQEFVDTYFDNLDVQQEINNKLDEMVEDGTLQQIIASYLQTQIIYDTTEAMIADAEHLVNGVRVETLGYRAVDDGGAAFFVIKNTGTADGYGVIDLENGLYAHMIYLGNSVRPEQFGAYGDGVNDHNDSSAIQYAINSGKTVEFSPKTYTCFALTVTSPTTIHGNGATLKRPELDISPYNYTVDQMKTTKTISITADIYMDHLNFDNNCFTMWSLADGYAQEQSASIILNNDSDVITAFIDHCTFKNSAGDGILVYNRVKAFITNCESTETFRGGLTMVGTSEINVDGWISNSITLPDGFDVEMAAGASAGRFILNMNNIIMDNDLDIFIPDNGTAHLSNITMRPFDQDTKIGFRFECLGNATLTVDNSTLRSGYYDNFSTYLNSHGKITFNNCNIIGNSTTEMFSIVTNNSAGDIELNLNNCNIKCYNCLMYGLFEGQIKVDNCDIECSNSFTVQRGNVAPQCKNLTVKNSRIKTVTDFIYVHQTQYVTWAEGVNLYLDNIAVEGTGAFKISGSPKIHYRNLMLEASYNTTFANGATPTFIGYERVIVVPAAANLTFKGWKAGNDIALALDDGNYYRYTSGTTWTAM